MQSWLHGRHHGGDIQGTLQKLANALRNGGRMRQGARVMHIVHQHIGVRCQPEVDVGQFTLENTDHSPMIRGCEFRPPQHHLLRCDDFIEIPPHEDDTVTEPIRQIRQQAINDLHRPAESGVNPACILPGLLHRFEFEIAAGI